MEVVAAEVDMSQQKYPLTNVAVDVDMSGGDVTIQLPSAASSTGKILTVKHSLGSVSTYTLKITSAGGTIDGQAEQTISQAKSSTRISSDGTHWKVI